MRKTEWIVRVTPQEATAAAARASAAGQPVAVWLRTRALRLAKATERWSAAQLARAVQDPTSQGVRHPRSRTLRLRVAPEEADAIENGRQVFELRLRGACATGKLDRSDFLRLAARY